MKHRSKRNWSQYNQRLKRIARVDFFISQEAVNNWYYKGSRKSGGVVLYSDHVIELCLMIREYFKFGLRQTQGFIESLLPLLGNDLKVPDYTTLSRRCSKLNISFDIPRSSEAMVVAIDSTGLSVHSRREWNKLKHKKKDYKWSKKWRKLHVIINVKTGHILTGKYTEGSANDGKQMPPLLESIEGEVSDVCGDMAYDTVQCREAIYRKKANQLIPPIHKAQTTDNQKERRKHKEVLKQRDEVIKYIKNNNINGDSRLARKTWKQKSGYHARSLIETTMWQIKAHTSDRLTNRTELTRKTQSMIKCKIVNKIISSIAA